MGTRVERGVELTGLAQDATGVTATVRNGGAEHTLRPRTLTLRSGSW